MTSVPHSVCTQLMSLQIPPTNELTAQLITCCRKNCPSAQTLATHEERQAMSMLGIPPPPPKPKQPKAQVRPAEQLRIGHAPQSTVQFEHVS